jgi:hypothetical protein
MHFNINENEIQIIWNKNEIKKRFVDYDHYNWFFKTINRLVEEEISPDLLTYVKDVEPIFMNVER